MKKLFVLNADDFGLSVYHNAAVLSAYNAGLLKSASICANGEAFSEAVEIAKNCPELALAVHLNIIEGKALTKCPLLTDENGNFNRSYGYFILNSHNKEFLAQVEAEFEAQIVKTVQVTKVIHLDSHVHTHGIPKIFEIICRLAKKYNIEIVRTQFEKPYFVPKTILKPINLVKVMLLQMFTIINRQTLKKYQLKTNDLLIGIGYTGMMNSKIIKYGLKVNNTGLVEALMHPCKYDDNTFDSHSVEYDTTQDAKLKSYIVDLGFEISNFENV